LDGSDPLKNIALIEDELLKYSPELAAKPRWLVLNKIDLLPAGQWTDYGQFIKATLPRQIPVFEVSALQRIGTKALCYALGDFLQQADQEVI
jgi:GTP-binding protein